MFFPVFQPSSTSPAYDEENLYLILLFPSFPAFTSFKVGLKALPITSHASASFRPAITFANPL